MHTPRNRAAVQMMIRKIFSTAHAFCWYQNDDGTGVQFDMREPIAEYRQLSKLARVLNTHDIIIERTLHGLVITTRQINPALKPPDDWPKKSKLPPRHQ